MTITVHDPVRPDPVPPLIALHAHPSLRTTRSAMDGASRLFETSCAGGRRWVFRRAHPPRTSGPPSGRRAAGGRRSNWDLVGGYARTVTERVAHVDEDAQTYMVLGDGDELLRVPLRDITSTRDETATDDGGRPRSGRDAEGLGTE